jgi:hypothetical protein
METQWEAIVRPKIEAKLQQQLHNGEIVPSGRNIVMVRGQLEKNVQLKKLRLDRARCESSTFAGKRSYTEFGARRKM